MALDESRDNDEVFDHSGITYVIEKGLLERIKPVKVDFITSAMGSGFNIESNMKKDTSCGGSCSC